MRHLLFLLVLWATPSFAIPLSTIGTFCGTFPDQCRKGTESLMAVRGSGTNAYYVLEANPTTGAIPVDASGSTIVVTDASVGPTGAAVPADASYTGLNNAGTLIGAIGDSSGRTIVVGPGTAGSATGGVLTVQGVTSMTPLLAAGTGTAGTAATGVVTVQGITSMTPLLVNGSGSTQPVSGTVAATESGIWTVQPGNTANTTPWLVTGSGTAGSAASGVITVQGIASMTALSTDQTTATGTFQDGAIAFGSLTTSFATVVTTGGVVRIVQLRNNTNAVVNVSLDGGSTTAYTLDSGDAVSDDLKIDGRSIPISTALQAKYTGAAPTSGSIRINVVY